METLQEKVKLTSDKTYTVFRSISYIDKSINPEKTQVIMSQNLINVVSTMGKNKVVITKGIAEYNAEILSWGPVKGLIKSGHIHIIEDKPFNRDANKAKKRDLSDLAK